jgi:hypothetical protein
MMQKIEIEGGGYYHWPLYSPFTGHLVSLYCQLEDGQTAASFELDPEFISFRHPYGTENFTHPDLPALLNECGIIPSDTEEDDINEMMSDISSWEDMLPWVGTFSISVRGDYPDMMIGEGFDTYTFAPLREVEAQDNKLPRFTETSVPVVSIKYDGQLHSFYSGLPVDLDAPDSGDETVLFVYCENSDSPWKYTSTRLIEKCPNGILPANPEALVASLNIGFAGRSYALAYRVSSANDGVVWYGFAPLQEMLDELF